MSTPEAVPPDPTQPAYVAGLEKEIAESAERLAEAREEAEAARAKLVEVEAELGAVREELAASRAEVAALRAVLDRPARQRPDEDSTRGTGGGSEDACGAADESLPRAPAGATTVREGAARSAGPRRDGPDDLGIAASSNQPEAVASGDGSRQGPVARRCGGTGADAGGLAGGVDESVAEEPAEVFPVPEAGTGGASSGGGSEGLREMDRARSGSAGSGWLDREISRGEEEEASVPDCGGGGPLFYRSTASVSLGCLWWEVVAWSGFGG